MIFWSFSFLAFCLKNGIFLQNHENFFLKNTMKNRFFSTYQKENCCLDHFGFKTPDDILFCPLYHYYKKPQFNNGFKVSGSSISNKIKDECWFYRNNIFESCNDHHRHHHDPNSKNLTVVETQKLNFKCLTDLTSDTPLN